jgi:hypothetical protein
VGNPGRSQPDYPKLSERQNGMMEWWSNGIMGKREED